MNQSFNYKAVCRTAPATPGLLKMINSNFNNADLKRPIGGIPIGELTQYLNKSSKILNFQLSPIYREMLEGLMVSEVSTTCSSSLPGNRIHQSSLKAAEGWEELFREVRSSSSKQNDKLMFFLLQKINEEKKQYNCVIVENISSSIPYSVITSPGLFQLQLHLLGPDRKRLTSQPCPANQLPMPKTLKKRLSRIEIEKKMSFPKHTHIYVSLCIDIQ